jgi:dihydropteroate synthase
VSKAMLAKYLDEVLPVMDQQDARIQEQLMESMDTEAAAKVVQIMMQRTKERMQIEFLRDTASRM